ncbi:MAG: class I SAM-dependent methyltransferase [Syntrophomonas sp.]
MSDHHHDSLNARNFTDKIAFLDGVQRRNIFPPEEILKMLSIKKSGSILDAGAGSGYLTIPAAKLVEGCVYALDMDTRMLEVINAKAKAENITNIQLLQGSIDNIPLPEGSVDLALASLILHEVRPLSKVFQQISHVLKQDGYFLCLEYEKKESILKGPPMNLRINSSEMEEELVNAGFSIVQKVFPIESIYIITAKKSGG